MSSQQQLINALTTDHLHKDLKERSVRGGAVTLASQITQFLVNSISTVVLARLLTPADFGLVAMVVAILGVGQAFADLGLSEATIQYQGIDHNQVTALFWVNVAIGLTLAMITIGLGPAIAQFYREPRLLNITFVLSLTFVIGGLRVQHDALLKRQMRFSALAIRDVVSSIIAIPTAIMIAWRGGGYWALVAFPLTFNFIQTAFSWLLVRWVPSLPQQGSKTWSLISFGGNVAASYVVITMTRCADSVLIGRFWGANPLGLYSRAYNLLMLPVRQVTNPARSVAVPAFSRLQAAPERFARYYLRSINLMTWIIAPLFGYLFVAAEPVIVLTLGSRWRDAAPVFQILCIAALGQLLFESAIWLFISQGKSRRLLQLVLITSPVIVAGYAMGLPFGIKGVALSGSLVILGTLPWVLSSAFRDTTLTLRRLRRAIQYPVVLSLTGILGSECLLRLIAPQTTVRQLMVVALGFATTYVLSTLVPPIRAEALLLRQLFNEVRFSRQTA